MLLTLGLSAWCAHFCTSRAGTASCLCPADSLCASWVLPGEALQREDAGQPWQRDREREREVWSKVQRFRYNRGIQTEATSQGTQIVWKLKKKERRTAPSRQPNDIKFWFLQHRQVSSWGPLHFLQAIFGTHCFLWPFISWSSDSASLNCKCSHPSWGTLKHLCDHLLFLKCLHRGCETLD